MTNENKLPLTFCRLLQRLRNNEKIPVGKFSSKLNKQLLNDFISENLLQISPQGRTHYVYCKNLNYLDNHLQSMGIGNLREHIIFIQKQESTRAEATQKTANSKYKKGRIFNGFFVKSCKPLWGSVNGRKIALKPQTGTWLYIENYKTFKIDPKITVIGVENSETFAMAENYTYLFADTETLFLLRFNNNSYIEWLRGIQNNYLHFGDFDLSALAIYITEFRNKLDAKRCNFFIPKNIETLISSSKNRKDYLKQLNDKRVKNIDFENYPEVRDLANLIHKEKKTAEQEVLMKLPY
jgi:hypothetical protein